MNHVNESSKMPLVLSYGVGVDSTAVLVGFWRLGIVPNLIMFADTFSERDETYKYLPIINAWLRSIGFPEITVVEYRVKNFKKYPDYCGLEENCLTNGTLPSEAFGFGSCSMKWKQSPQDKFLKTWEPAIKCWENGGKIRRVIGYDNGKADKKRSGCAIETFKINGDDPRYSFWFPLQEWGWDRDRCIAEIKLAGLPVPVKSSCFFCPNMRPCEVDTLSKEKLARIVILEARAKPRLLKIKGLWRNGCAGRRGGEKRPGMITDYIRERGLLSKTVIDSLIATVPKTIIARMASAEKNGRSTVESWTEFFKTIFSNINPNAADDLE